MSQQSLMANIKACVFDAYGTLFDVHSAVGKYYECLGDVADQVSNIWRSKQLEYTWLRSLMKKHADFWQVTQDALDYALDVFDITDHQLKKDLINAYLFFSFTHLPHARRGPLLDLSCEKITAKAEEKNYWYT